MQRNGLTYCQLSGFHTAISNCGDEELYRYVGTSSLKRRQFLERRTHIFHIAHTDTVGLLSAFPLLSALLSPPLCPPLLSASPFQSI